MSNVISGSPYTVVVTVAFGDWHDVPEIVSVAQYDTLYSVIPFTLFVGWKMSRTEVYDEFTNGGTLKANVFLFNTIWFLIRYVAPVGILVVFLTNLVL